MMPVKETSELRSSPQLSARAQRLLPVMLLMVCLLFSGGCIGAMTQLLYVLKGHKVPAAYDGLKDKKIAVVCVSDASAYGPDTLTYTIANTVSLKLATSVKDVEIIPPREIERWIDSNGWNERDYVEIGRGVGADSVLAIEISAYSIHEGATMYKGRSDLTATVIDITGETENGRIDFVYGPNLFEFPEHGRPAIQTSDRQFEAFYLAKLTENIARQFYQHDQMETVAEDAMSIR